MMEKIEQVLDEKVRPSLRSHGGAIEVLEFTDNVVYFKLLGQCASCPSSYITTEELIQAELTAAIPEVDRVVLVQQVSEDLLEQARKILRHEQ